MMDGYLRGRGGHEDCHQKGKTTRPLAIDATLFKVIMMVMVVIMMIMINANDD